MCQIVTQLVVAKKDDYFGVSMTKESRPSESFSREETAAIRRILSTRNAAYVCPRCGGALALEGPVAGGGSVGFVWRVECPTCDLTAFVAENVARRLEDS